jgi:mRNA-degrading endonuclease RelE of RelBE toxin-antitoxin system
VKIEWSPTARMRVGSYRVVYVVDDDVITIERADHLNR